MQKNKLNETILKNLNIYFERFEELKFKCKEIKHIQNKN